MRRAAGGTDIKTTGRAAFALLFAVTTLVDADAALSRGKVAKVTEDWIVCSTRETAQRLAIYVKSGDQFGIDGIISHGLGVNVGEGTRMKIVDIASGYCEVRVVSGANINYLGWVSSDLLMPASLP